LHAVAEREGVGVGGAFLGAREHVQSAEDYFRCRGAIPVGELEGALANVRWTVMPTTCGIGWKGGRPSSRFSSQ
jgi:hypothetical protein